MQTTLSRTLALLSLAFLLPAPARAATDVKVEFSLTTTDKAAKPVTQNRLYYVYRPDNLPKDKPAPMLLCMNNSPATFFHRKADEAGFILVSCVILGHTNPHQDGLEDLDYTTAVIDKVADAENANDAFICGFSMGGHMTCAFACDRPNKIKAAADADEFMGLTTNIPAAPVPMIFFHGTNDITVPYAMTKDTADTWRKNNGLLNTTPVTTFEPSPLTPGQVFQTTWQGPTPVSFVTIIGGTHAWPTSAVHSGFDITDAIWSFFAQFLTPASRTPKITAIPVNNIQYAGHPASFHIAATGDAPLTYQWQKNGKDIPAATNNFYTTPPTTKDDPPATYRAIVTNRLGSVTSPEATLTLKPAPPGPTIVTHPKDQSTAAGKPVTFVVRTDETPDPPFFKFQWQKNGIPIQGATAPDLTLPAPTTFDSGATFRALITSPAGTSTSIPATLTVTPAKDAPIIVTNPARFRAHPGDTATFSVTAQSATPMTYQWQTSTRTTNYLNIPNATAPTYSTPPVTLADHVTLFRCIITNPAGAAASAAEMLFVTNPNPPPNAGATLPAKPNP